jgi:pimeloyl-ACP methyl ester carboxylesterase
VKRLFVALAVAASLGVAPAAHGAYTTTEHVATMDDGVGIAVTLYTPAGLTGPAPAVMVFHGLGGNRQSVAPIAQVFADAGYLALTFDVRGHGQSGGLFAGLDARELLDIARLRESWLPANAPLDGDKVGAWAVSLGGGAALRSAGEGTPFKALAVVETFTDLYEALVPQNLPKSGAVFQFLGAVPVERQAPELLAVRDLVARRDVDALVTFSQARSSRHLLPRGYPPTLFFQGRRDFAFGLEQGIGGWRAHGGTKALYIGPFGHAPSRFPGPDLALVMQRAVRWFDQHVRGVVPAAGQPAVELVAEDGTTVRASSALPSTRTHTWRFRARSTIRSAGKAVRRVRAPRLLETFGAPTVRARVTSTTGWSHLVAVLVARTPSGQEIVVSEGGTPTNLGARPTTVTIRLIAQVTRIPAGSRLELTLAGTSTAQHPGNLLYLVPVPERARITIRNVTVAVPVLRSPVSR